MTGMPEGFVLRESVTYPNGGTSTFWACDDVAVVVDDGICLRTEGEPPFDYSLITSKQNAYIRRYSRVFRLLREDLAELDRWLESTEGAYDIELQSTPARRPPDRANNATASPLEMAFEQHFANVYGDGSERFLQREYAVTDPEGHVYFVDYVVRTADGLVGVEENDVSYHHPQLIGTKRYRRQLLKQNSCTRAGIKLYRFSTEDCRFDNRLEDDILSFFGRTPAGFLDSGMLVDRRERDRRLFNRALADAQIEAWDQGIGGCYWSYRVDDPRRSEWSLRTCVAKGWVDMHCGTGDR